MEKSQSCTTTHSKRLPKREVIARFAVISLNKERIDTDIRNFTDYRPFILSRTGRQIAFPYPSVGAKDPELVALMNRCGLRWGKNKKRCRFIVGTEIGKFETPYNMISVQSSYEEFKRERSNKYITPGHLIRFINIDFSRSLSTEKNEEIYLNMEEDNEVLSIESGVSNFRQRHFSNHRDLKKSLGKLFN